MKLCESQSKMLCVLGILKNVMLIFYRNWHGWYALTNGLRICFAFYLLKNSNENAATYSYMCMYLLFLLMSIKESMLLYYLVSETLFIDICMF